MLAQIVLNCKPPLYSKTFVYCCCAQPLNRQGHGRLLCLICKVSGLLTEICPDYIEELRNMRSFIRMEIFLKPGQVVKKTIDCFTLAGVVMVSDMYMDSGNHSP